MDNKVFVSPHRRTIQTALNILKSHPQLENGITFILFPMAKEVMNNSNDLPLSRAELDKFLDEQRQANPSIDFDTSLLDRVVKECPYPDQDLSSDEVFSDDKILGNPDLWFLHIQSSMQLKKELFSIISQKFTETGSQSMEIVYDVVMDKFKKGKGVEGNLGCYNRVQRLKEMLKEYYEKELSEEEKAEIEKESNTKILVVTHSRVL